jgi:hypothetical protein
MKNLLEKIMMLPWRINSRKTPHFGENRKELVAR